MRSIHCHGCQSLGEDLHLLQPPLREPLSLSSELSGYGWPCAASRPLSARALGVRRLFVLDPACCGSTCGLELRRWSDKRRLLSCKRVDAVLKPSSCPKSTCVPCSSKALRSIHSSILRRVFGSSGAPSSDAAEDPAV